MRDTRRPASIARIIACLLEVPQPGVRMSGRAGGRLKAAREMPTLASAASS